MSFILDALKKSEQERVRQQAPTTLELPRSTRRRVTPAWMIGVLVLLLVNCVLLFMMWLRHEPETPAATATKAEASLPGSAVSKPVAPSANRLIRSLEEEASVETPAAEDTEIAPGPTIDGQDHEAPLVRAMPATDASPPETNLPANSASRRVSAGMPTLESLGGHAALDLPELRLDLHVYAPAAKDRFVFINGKRYREGEITAEGVTVESITDDGVVLSKSGRRFLLPR